MRTGVGGSGRLIFDEATESAETIEAHERLWQHCFDVNFFGVLNCTRAFLPSLCEQGRAGEKAVLANISSVNGFWTWPEHSAYTASKHAVKVCLAFFCLGRRRQKYQIS